MTPDAYQRFSRTLIDRLDGMPAVLGLVALGSMAARDYGPDRWSDHDFFVIVEADFATCRSKGSRPAFSTISILPAVSNAVTPAPVRRSPGSPRCRFPKRRWPRSTWRSANSVGGSPTSLRRRAGWCAPSSRTVTPDGFDLLNRAAYAAGIAGAGLQIRSLPVFEGACSDPNRDECNHDTGNEIPECLR